METIDLIIKILPILAIFAGLVRYLISEIAKKKERIVAQLMALRNQIQNDLGIAEVMYLCESNKLTSKFFSSDDEENIGLYKEVVKILGLFDTMTYSFITRNLYKNVFLYFIGEMEGVIRNSAIQEYLDYLLVCNMEDIEDRVVEEKLMFDLAYPYGFYQLFMRLDSTRVLSIPSFKIRSKIIKEKKLVNKELYMRLIIK